MAMRKRAGSGPGAGAVPNWDAPDEGIPAESSLDARFRRLLASVAFE
jgi:hypothetical protein